ncbi:acetoacetate-CoA ligase [Rhizodiscina lignyota]|uniref:Acetoacetate-CoA ligase n=1 Tax=Rhizodiscina lignyota TaxID=1504668 RepID=A0A9P4I7F2_9PEZI|nr:acetoacetate-CoA ligase [Rhizodiscina lignyota]
MASNTTTPKPVWEPKYGRPNAMDKYRQHVNSKFSLSLQNSQELHKWSVTNSQKFWLDVYNYLELVPALPSTMTRAYDDTVPMSTNPPWYEGLDLNYAENVLLNADKVPNNTALIGLREGQKFGTEEKMTWTELREQVRVVQSALRRSGVKKGDRIAALVSNSVWGIVLFLASASVGAIYSSIAPDLGVEGCVSRLQQIDATILFVDSHSSYKGRRTHMDSKIEGILARLGSSKPKETFIIPKVPETSKYPTIESFLIRSSQSDPLKYDRVPFNCPLIICYSSGTTGTPKCIVHQHGIILNLKKVSHLHNTLSAGDVVLQYSSTSWIMFYIMNGHLATGATTVAYDGSPFWPDVRSMLRILEYYKVSYYGSSPRYLLELEINRVNPRKEFDLSNLRIVNVTGASLAHTQYYWFYNNFPTRVHLCNVAGGTDTATSLLAADPCGPLVPGEMQMFGLGMDIDIADPETGYSIKETGQPGELVVRKPFPSMPAFFWGDEGGKKYHASYFERFDKVDVWAQHDWVTWNPATAGVVMSGRSDSDGVLNPSGIRFGSGEVYAIVEGPDFNAEIADTLCVGRRRAHENDETVFLFVKMLPGKPFTEEIRQKLRTAIAKGLSSRHVPKFIIPVDDIPVTINGKKVEIAVKQLISGKDIKVSSTVANPEVLLSYKKYKDLEETPRAKL